MIIRPSAERGRSQLSWLNSQHSFSFGHYYDPHHQGFSHLLVINDDQVAPGGGFAQHGHRDMEIISYVRSGTLAHRDSLGTEEHIRAGEFQLMRAGSGIQHSEFNASQSEPVHFLQIWIKPAQRGLPPSYQQRAFPRQDGLQAIATPDGADGTLQIAQDATLYRWQGERLDYQPQGGRWLYLHLLEGKLAGEAVALRAGDGLLICECEALHLQGQGEALLFDLPAE
ncbi:pirin family protein [Pseudomonas cavernae]|uniref:Pirin family protein n=1 Tax=Pseudomonas cavernae TaxID=2320867 RepID=A0A385Z4P3_9PSED|nr:pirin family protein [Pseudomonas cavernae]AYC34106.1 pirin family protein [Pseudomonas cavernae]